MIQSTDQMGRFIELPEIPKRIISLVPSQTELLYSLGLKDEVVGQTLFCVHPDWAHQSKPRIGGTKKIKFDGIAALAPDLIIGNMEENDESQIRALMEKHPVWMSDIQTIPDALEMIIEIGKIVGKSAESDALAKEIQHSLNQINQAAAGKKVLYLIWNDPIMVAGKETFIDAMIQACGMINAAETLDGRYPNCTIDEIVRMAPDYLLLSSEPFPFKEKHILALNEKVPNSKAILVDGELFSWYGSRLLLFENYWNKTVQTLIK